MKTKQAYAIKIVLLLCNFVYADSAAKVEQLSSGLVFKNTPAIFSDFTLYDTNYNLFDKNSLQNKWHLVFFGYSKCPIFCPEILAKMNNIANRMQGTDILFTMISIDPDNDSPEHLKEYLAGINPKFVGITGDIENVKVLANQLNLVIGEYDMDSDHIEHSSNLALLGPDSRLHAILSVTHEPSLIVQDLRKIQYMHYR